MKKIISLALVVMMLFSLSVVAFADAGSWDEAQTCASVTRKCAVCDACTGKFGCSCCEKCPGAVDINGTPINLASLIECSYGYYVDRDFTAPDGTEHFGDFETHYYWKTPCCENCTGLVGCHCNCGNCIYCPEEPKDEFDEKFEEARETAINGFSKGIQSALTALRKVLYDLFDRLFEFLRLEDVLGKTPGTRQ